MGKKLVNELREHERDYPELIHGPLCGKAADEIERLHSIAVERMALFRQAATKVEQADALLLAFVAAYEQQDADAFTDAMRNVYAAADLFVSAE